jgi:hypothetical protein
VYHGSEFEKQTGAKILDQLSTLPQVFIVFLFLGCCAQTTSIQVQTPDSSFPKFQQVSSR